jgi:hypothetical protein
MQEDNRMKRITLLLAVSLFAVVFAGSQAVYAQHAHGGGPGAGMSGGMGMSHSTSAGSHADMGSSSVSQGTAASSPQEVFNRNSTLNTTLTTKLQSKNLLPSGTDLKTACDGFRNLGQCMAAIHVSHNLNVPFACYKADMTGAALPTGTTCPAAVSTSNLSLGKTIQAFSPNTNSGAEAKSGTKEANSDISEAESAK